MLIEFSVTNFRSIRDRQTLSLAASSAKELAARNTFRTGFKNLPSLVHSAAIYGPNAAGKTNLLRAALVMQQTVTASAAAGQVGQTLNVQPFALSRETRSVPSEFEIHFIHEKVRYQYGFSATSTRVFKEWLVAYPSGRPQLWFKRSYNAKSKKSLWEFGPKLRGTHKVWRDATRPNALFLSTAVQLNNMQLKPVFDWFQNRMTVVVPGVEFNRFLTFDLFSKATGKSMVMQFLEAADLGISDIQVKREPFNINVQGTPQLLPQGHVFVTAPGTLEAFSARVFHKANDSKELVDFDLGEESNGTQKIFQQIGALLRVLSVGAVVFIDEMESSLHPKLVRFLIELFQSPETNRRNAQLVFSTHDTSVLNNELLRRDQIWFVEKAKLQSSQLYSMADFSRRKDEPFEKNYLKGRYGALPILGELLLNGH